MWASCSGRSARSGTRLGRRGALRERPRGPRRADRLGLRSLPLRPPRGAVLEAGDYEYGVPGKLGARRAAPPAISTTRRRALPPPRSPPSTRRAMPSTATTPWWAGSSASPTGWTRGGWPGSSGLPAGCSTSAAARGARWSRWRAQGSGRCAGSSWTWRPRAALPPRASTCARAISWTRTSSPDSFDLIRMGHVIEHVRDPLATLRRAWELLKPGGTLFGETPNIDCWDFELFGRYWGALHFPRHIALFSPETISEACERAGFDGRPHHPAAPHGGLERGHPELAGRSRRAPRAGRTVACAGIRCSSRPSCPSPCSRPW